MSSVLENEATPPGKPWLTAQCPESSSYVHSYIHPSELATACEMVTDLTDRVHPTRGETSPLPRNWACSREAGLGAGSVATGDCCSSWTTARVPCSRGRASAWRRTRAPVGPGRFPPPQGTGGRAEASAVWSPPPLPPPPVCSTGPLCWAPQAPPPLPLPGTASSRRGARRTGAGKRRSCPPRPAAPAPRPSGASTWSCNRGAQLQLWACVRIGVCSQGVRAVVTMCTTDTIRSCP
jgi:hypothetical protein